MTLFGIIAPFGSYGLTRNGAVPKPGVRYLSITHPFATDQSSDCSKN